eukprot:scaffold1448_cov181-Ochromonas_danica.AAC.1
MAEGHQVPRSPQDTPGSLLDTSDSSDKTGSLSDTSGSHVGQLPSHLILNWTTDNISTFFRDSKDMQGLRIQLILTCGQAKHYLDSRGRPTVPLDSFSDPSPSFK